MALTFQILGDAGRDNALLVTVDSGQAVSRLLLDCGEGCLACLPFGDIQAIDHLLFSHLHMDPECGHGCPSCTATMRLHRHQSGGP